MATGDTLVIFIPSANEPPGSNFATMDTVNEHLVLDFQAFSTTAEIAIFPGVMPQHFGGGNIVVYLHYSMSTATSGNIELTCTFERREETANMLADDYGTAVITGDVGVPGTARILDITTTTHDSAGEKDSIVAGDAFHLKIERTEPETSDAAGDLELWKVELREA